MPNLQNNLLHALKQIRAFVFDVDGVLTDGNILLLANGEWLRKMNVRDGFAIQHAIKTRYKVCVISEDSSEAVGKRLDALGVPDIYFSADGKLAAFEKFIIDRETDVHEIMYMGDDVNDLPCLKAAGLAVCPQDAVPEVKAVCHYVAQAKGGEGCVREVIEMVMKSHKVWDF